MEKYLHAFMYKKWLPAEFHLPKPGARPLCAKLPWNYIRCRSRGSSLERFCKLEIGSRYFFNMQFCNCPSLKLSLYKHLIILYNYSLYLHIYAYMISGGAL